MQPQNTPSLPYSFVFFWSRKFIINLLLFLSGDCWVRQESNGTSPSPQAALASCGNRLGLLGQVFDHQAPQRGSPMMLGRSGTSGRPIRLQAHPTAVGQKKEKIFLDHKKTKLYQWVIPKKIACGAYNALENCFVKSIIALYSSQNPYIFACDAEFIDNFFSRLILMHYTLHKCSNGARMRCWFHFMKRRNALYSSQKVFCLRRTKMNTDTTTPSRVRSVKNIWYSVVIKWFSSIKYDLMTFKCQKLYACTQPSLPITVCYYSQLPLKNTVFLARS